MRTPCVRCGSPGDHHHHPCGSDDAGAHMNPEFVVWLCKPCHLGDHNARHILELEYAKGRLTIPERIELCLRRVAAFLTSLRDPWAPLTTPLAVAMSRWADDLAGFRRRLDVRYPGWRTEIG